MADGLTHSDRNCFGKWAQELHGSRTHWRCNACGVVCYEGVGIFHAVVIEHAMGAVLERLTREGRKNRGDFGPSDGWEG